MNLLILPCKVLKLTQYVDNCCVVKTSVIQVMGIIYIRFVTYCYFKDWSFIYSILRHVSCCMIQGPIKFYEMYFLEKQKNIYDLEMLLIFCCQKWNLLLFLLCEEWITQFFCVLFRNSLKVVCIILWNQFMFLPKHLLHMTLSPTEWAMTGNLLL